MDVGLVCDGCSTYNQLGASACVNCQVPISLDRADTVAAVLTPMESDTTNPTTCSFDAECPGCGANIQQGNRFCGACGTSVTPIPPGEGEPVFTAPTTSPPTSKSASKQTLFFSSIQAAKAKLVLIRGEGHDGESYSLAGEEHRIGRSDADIVFDEDPFLSPVHANFVYVAGKLMVRDENSTNGVFIRIHGKHPIEHNDHFLVGEQVMQVMQVVVEETMQPTEDGTYFYASPTPPCSFVLHQKLHSGTTGKQCLPTDGIVSLGRENNHFNFPDDPFISGNHAQVSIDDSGAMSLTDLDSKNGTFIRITKPRPLAHGDYVFMGQQLLRVEIV